MILCRSSKSRRGLRQKQQMKSLIGTHRNPAPIHSLIPFDTFHVCREPASPKVRESEGHTRGVNAALGESESVRVACYKGSTFGEVPLVKDCVKAATMTAKGKRDKACECCNSGGQGTMLS